MKPASMATCIISQNVQWSGFIVRESNSTKMLITIQPYMPICQEVNDQKSVLNACYQMVGLGSSDIAALAQN